MFRPRLKRGFPLSSTAVEELCGVACQCAGVAASTVRCALGSMRPWGHNKHEHEDEPNAARGGGEEDSVAQRPCLPPQGPGDPAYQGEAGQSDQALPTGRSRTQAVVLA